MSEKTQLMILQDPITYTDLIVPSATIRHLDIWQKNEFDFLSGELLCDSYELHFEATYDDPNEIPYLELETGGRVVWFYQEKDGSGERSFMGVAKCRYRRDIETPYQYYFDLNLRGNLHPIIGDEIFSRSHTYDEVVDFIIRNTESIPYDKEWVRTQYD